MLYVCVPEFVVNVYVVGTAISGDPKVALDLDISPFDGEKGPLDVSDLLFELLPFRLRFTVVLVRVVRMDHEPELRIEISMATEPVCSITAT